MFFSIVYFLIFLRKRFRKNPFEKAYKKLLNDAENW